MLSYPPRPSRKNVYEGVCATMNANRRLQERKQPERMVYCKLGGEESGSVLDLSEDGLRFESLAPVEEADSLHVRLSVDPNSAIEATGKLAWIDSAKRTGGLRFLDLSAPAREQIRAWLGETAPASSETGPAPLQNRDKQAHDGAAIEKPALLEETRGPSTQLVPIEQYRKQTRVQFLRGVLVGFGICVVMMIPILVRYARGPRSGSSALATASTNRAAQSSGEETRPSVAQPVSPNASILERPAAKPLATQRAAVQTVSAAAPTVPRQKQSPQTAGASSTNLVTRTSLPLARSQPANAGQPLGASLAATTTAPAASKAPSSLQHVQHPEKVSATAQQLWSALQAGNINAALALADLYARGEGVPVNCQQARVLLLAAAEKNIPEASRKLRELNKGGCPANKE